MIITMWFPSRPNHRYQSHRRRHMTMTVLLIFVLSAPVTTATTTPMSSSSSSPSLRGRRGLENDLSPVLLMVDERQPRSSTNTGIVDNSGIDNGTMDSEEDNAHATHPSPFPDPVDGTKDIGLVVILVATLVSLTLIMSMAIREYYFRKHGIDICHNNNNTRCFFLFSSKQRRSQVGSNDSNDDDNNDGGRRLERRSSSSQQNNNQREQYEADRALAMELQRQLDEEDRETYRLAKRDERRKWFEFYMRDRSMVVKNEDLFFGQELSNSASMLDTRHHDRTNDSDAESTMMTLEEPSTSLTLTPTPGPSRRNRIMSLGESSDDDLSTDDDLYFDDHNDGDDDDVGCQNGESGRDSKSKHSRHQDCFPTVCDKGDEDAQLYLKMPTDKMKKEHACLYVDGECALCIDEYQPGDEVVWSDLKCNHVFHKECIMQWLSKGKKRCPVCRNWFVPGARIEDQKNQQKDSWNAFLSEIQNQNPDNENESTAAEMTEEAADHSDSSLVPPINAEERSDVSDYDIAVRDELQPQPTLNRTDSTDMHLPCRKETDCTERTAQTHAEESESSSSSQICEVESGSSFEESNNGMLDHDVV